MVLEKTLESPLDYKEIQPVHSEGDQSWVFIGKTEAKAETPILWCILSPCLFNLYAEYIMRNAGLEEAKPGIKIAGRNINTLPGLGRSPGEGNGNPLLYSCLENHMDRVAR